MKAIILAGGSGTRLWPMSRQTQPKQFSKVVSEVSLIRETYRRLLPLFPPEKIYFSISPAFCKLLAEEFPEVADDHIFAEPARRDTGPAMGYVAAMLALEDPDEPMVFIPSDHYIADEAEFLRCLEVGGRLVEETGKLLDIAVVPTFPSTALGYTRIGEACDMDKNVEVFRFAGHREKPALPTAQQYLKDGSFLWHANYYMWTPRKFLEAFDRYAPEIGSKLKEIQEATQYSNHQRIIDLFESMPKISIDFAMTENMSCHEVLIIKGDFGWSDIGAWDVLYDRLAEGIENVTKGDPIVIDTTRSIIYGQSKKTLAVLGLDGVVVVDTEDALLVCKIEHAQRVKEIIEQLKDNGREHHL